MALAVGGRGSGALGAGTVRLEWGEPAPLMLLQQATEFRVLAPELSNLILAHVDTEYALGKNATGRDRDKRRLGVGKPWTRRLSRRVRRASAPRSGVRPKANARER
jgi:hypothetical protein